MLSVHIYDLYIAVHVNNYSTIERLCNIAYHYQAYENNYKDSSLHAHAGCSEVNGSRREKYDQNLS